MKGDHIVFFFGAGFSKGFDGRMPIGADLLSATLEELNQERKDRKLLVEAIRRVFPHMRPENADIELLLGAIDAMRSKPHEGRDILGRINPDLIWRILVAGLGRALYRRSQVSYRKFTKSGSSMSALIEILKSCQRKFSSVSIITTNYDLIADKASNWLIDRRLRADGNTHLRAIDDLRRFQYGVPVRGQWKNAGGKSVFVQRRKPWAELSEAIPVYKLHGSINWAYCRTCNALDISKARADLMTVYNREQVHCAAGCGDSYDWLLVPPVHGKNYQNDILRTIWSRARFALAQATHVVFIGYSLPAADPSVTQLILMTHARSERIRGAPWKYWAVHPDCCAQERFQKLIGPAEQHICEYFLPTIFVSRLLRRII